MNNANNTKIIMDSEKQTEQKFDTPDRASGPGQRPDKAYTAPSGIGAKLRAEGLILCCAKESIKEKLQENETERSAAQPGYEHLYWVTNFGNVFSKQTNTKLTINTNKQGYYYVNLSNENNKKKRVGIAILVYKTWKGKDDPEYVDFFSTPVIRKDGNKLNNHISNLECVPRSDFTKNAIKNSTTVRGYGIRILMFYQTDEKCTKVVKTFENMHKVCEHLERKLKAIKGNIYKCLNGKRPAAYGYRWRRESPPPAKETVEDIDGFECLGIIEGKDFSNYEISREGIGASLRAGGLIVINKNANNEIMKARINRSGYLYVQLSSKGKQKQFRIHRLIGRYFLKKGKAFYDDSDFVINHIDENKLNNSVSNLVWTTQQKNVLHSSGVRVAKLDKNTLEILDIYESITEAYEDLNKKYSNGISYVCQGRQKTSAGFKWKYL